MGTPRVGLDEVAVPQVAAGRDSTWDRAPAVTPWPRNQPWTSATRAPCRLARPVSAALSARTTAGPSGQGHSSPPDQRRRCHRWGHKPWRQVPGPPTRGSRRHSCGTASSPPPGLRRRRSHRSTSSHQARHRHRTYTNHQRRATDPPPVPSHATGGASRISVAQWVVDGLLREGDVTRIVRRQSGRHISRRAEPGSSESFRRRWCRSRCRARRPARSRPRRRR